MCRIIKKLVCIGMVGFSLFIILTAWGEGGAKFREIGEKTGGIVQKVMDNLADVADGIANSIKEKFEKWSGKKNEKIKE